MRFDRTSLTPWVLLLALAPIQATAKITAPEWKAFRDGLAERQVPKAFVERARGEYERKDALDVLEKNIFGFLKRANYRIHLGGQSLKRCQAHLREHAVAYAEAEKRFGVDRRSIAALLWVETHLGKNMGSHSIVATYTALALGVSEDLSAAVLKIYREKYRAGRPDPADDERVIRERLQARSKWGLDELAELSKIHGREHRDIFKLRGSYAGAFGQAQFIPSSFRKWAVSYRKGRFPNLFRTEDAIMSVGSFLSANGWKEGLREPQSAALMEYNRVRGYGDVILELAEQLGKPSPSASSAPSRQSETRNPPKPAPVCFTTSAPSAKSCDSSSADSWG